LLFFGFPAKILDPNFEHKGLEFGSKVLAGNPKYEKPSIFYRGFEIRQNRSTLLYPKMKMKIEGGICAQYF
jgi:hypothetical protein